MELFNVFPDNMRSQQTSDVSETATTATATATKRPTFFFDASRDAFEAGVTGSDQNKKKSHDVVDDNKKPLKKRARRSESQLLQDEVVKQNDPDDTMDDFIINRPKGSRGNKGKSTIGNPKKSSSTSKKLEKAASASGQKKVSDFFSPQPGDSGYLPDLVSDIGNDLNLSIHSPRYVRVSTEAPLSTSSPSDKPQSIVHPSQSPVESPDKVNQGFVLLLD